MPNLEKFESIIAATTKVDAIFLTHLVLHWILESQDIITASLMISQQGLDFEANWRVKSGEFGEWLLHEPTKMLLIPAFVYIALSLAYLHCKKTKTERGPLVILASLNTLLAASIMIDTFSGTIARMSRETFDTGLTIIVAFIPISFWVLRDLTQRDELSRITIEDHVV